jgi:hypothetical protein
MSECTISGSGFVLGILAVVGTIGVASLSPTTGSNWSACVVFLFAFVIAALTD